MSEHDERAALGFVLILSAPSGAGKSTLVRHLVAVDSGVSVSISTTTRPPRPREREAVDYFFVDPESFRQRVADGAFLEWAEVFGNYYGTSRAFVADALARGRSVLMDIDWQGARQVRASLPVVDVVSVFIVPPSHDSLQQRLSLRGQDDAAVIAGRMAKAVDEMSHWEEYDYIVVNDDLAKAQQELVAIVRAERLRRVRCSAQMGALMASFTR